MTWCYTFDVTRIGNHTHTHTLSRILFNWIPEGCGSDTALLHAFDIFGILKTPFTSLDLILLVNTRPAHLRQEARIQDTAALQPF